jgi:cysteine desulfuration protein SufE
MLQLWAGGRQLQESRTFVLATIAEVQEELIEEFAFFDDWMDRYRYIIDLGRNLPDFPADKQTDAYKVRGCQSQVWFCAEPMVGGKLHFLATSDAHIVSGLIAILLRIYSDRTPEEILATKPDFVAAIGLDEHLSPTRNNGLHAMLTRIFAEAKAAAAAV